MSASEIVGSFGVYGDVHVDLGDDHVAWAEIRRPPHNHFDVALIAGLADAVEALDVEPGCRALVVCSAGKSFCAGAQLGGRGDTPAALGGRTAPGHLYDEAVRLFATRTPVVAAVQGAAIGGGLGLALWPDFRVGCPEARFSANFARLGFHHGFGLSVTLPALVGAQRAQELLYTGRRVKGEEAFRMGLVDRLVAADGLREAAHDLAREIAISAPLAVDSIRQTLRGELPARIRAATEREKAEQERLQKTADFQEGVRAMAERRTPRFEGH